MSANRALIRRWLYSYLEYRPELTEEQKTRVKIRFKIHLTEQTTDSGAVYDSDLAPGSADATDKVQKNERRTG